MVLISTLDAREPKVIVVAGGGDKPADSFIHTLPYAAGMTMDRPPEKKRHPVWVIGSVSTVLGGIIVATNFVFSAAGLVANGWVVGILLLLTGLVMMGFGSQMSWPNVSTVRNAAVGDAQELERLAKLHSEGSLTDEEYRVAKKRALS